MLIRRLSLPRPPIRFGTPPLPLLALLLALAGQLVLVGRESPWLGALLLASGGALIGLAASRAGPGRETSSLAAVGPADRLAKEPPDPGDALVGGLTGLAALLLVTLMAAAFRLPALGRLPPGLAPDEATLGLDAVRLLTAGWAGLAWGGWPIFHLFTLGSIAALGQTALAVRLPDAVAGILFAPALFLLGRQLGGTRLGTVAGLLGAVMFWHADLTRGAWGYAAWSLACETLGLAFLVRTLRRPTPGQMALAGLLLGLALQASWGTLAAIGVGALLAFFGPRSDLTARRNVGTVFGPFLVYFVVAAGPILFGVSIPDRPPDRVLADAGAGALVTGPAELLRRTGRLLLMFNVAGDPSPLHALRAEPMLDPVTGALLVLGLIVTLVRWRDDRTGVLVAWLLGSVAVAVLVGTSPQPDAVMAVHALAPALLLAASALLAAAGGLARHRPGEVAWHLDLTVMVLTLIAGINAHALYVRRPADAAAWSAYASAETMAAREISRLVLTSTIYLADVWIDHPTIRFLAPALTEPKRLDPATTLPLLEGDAFAYFTPGYLDVVPDDLERLYDDGELDRFRSPLDETNVVMRSFKASARDVAEARGVTLRATTDRARATRYTLAEYALDWPVPGEAARPATLDLFSAVLVPAAGVYRIRLDAPPEASLDVNGVAVSLVNREATVTLARGAQRFHILASVNGPARIELRWAPPGSTSLVRIPRERLSREQRGAIGLLALYRSGLDPAAPTELAQVERYLQRDAYPPPLARPYIGDWLGVLDAPRSGTYRFKLDASGPASLWIDDHPILSGTAATSSPFSVVLGEGDHRIQVRLIDMEGPTRLDLAWAPPGDDMDPIPTSRFGTPNAAVNAIVPFAVSADTAFVPLGTPKVRWLASTEGEPRAVAVGPNGDVILTNLGAHQIQQVVGEGRSLVGLPAALSVPSDVEVGPDGAVWALDALQGDVVRLGPDGIVDRSLNTRGLGLYRPRGLAIAPDGSVLVADTGGSRIVRLAGDGTLLDTIGPDIGGPERIRQPTDVVVGPGGELFVVNGEAGALLRLSRQGRYERHWPVLPSDTEKGAHLAIGPDRSIWVSEPEGRRVRRFTWDGTPSGVVDQTEAGRLLRSPVGIAVGPDGTLYVADASLRAIVAFGFER